MNENTALRASAWVLNRCRARSSHSIVAKKLSHMALSYASPTDPIEGFYNPRRRHSSIGYLSPIDYERRHHAMAIDPGAHQPAAVLAAAKDKPCGRPQAAAVLDRRCARRPQRRAGRDGRMAPPGTELKNISNQEDNMPSIR